MEGVAKRLGSVDWWVISVHLLASVLVGAFISRKRQTTANEYFLAGWCFNAVVNMTPA